MTENGRLNFFLRGFLQALGSVVEAQGQIWWDFLGHKVSTALGIFPRQHGQFSFFFHENLLRYIKALDTFRDLKKKDVRIKFFRKTCPFEYMSGFFPLESGVESCGRTEGGKIDFRQGSRLG